ncbi:MAG: GGDEF domain-containing protein [Rhodanobacter sp.]|nr:MAG: GGDEF domain-containing protein [Rhodanobacter sp.]TAM14127.1 MAG: GGDEF domain-containing protein [Rhodanobacter sp.]TAM34946.1 MAG: GGDEF domain-containing protein [Rhodanobacter sp.]
MQLQPTATPSIDHFKHLMLVVVIALGLLSTVAGWLVMDAQNVLTPALNWVLLGTTVVLTALLVATATNALPQRVIELTCLLYIALVSAVCMTLRMYWPQYATGLHLQPLYLWMPITYVLAFTLTDHRTGLALSCGLLVVFIALTLPYLARGNGAEYGNLTLQLHFVSIVIIAALYYFSSYQHQLGTAQRTVEQLAQLSNTDDLTGLSNRRHMALLLGADLAWNPGHVPRFAVVLFDIDRFKAINDELGHLAGDHTLIALAARARTVFRDTDSLGRWGGDEFVAVLRDVDVASARRKAVALCEAVAAAPLLIRAEVTISCGVAMARVGDNLDHLLQRADAALYAAKRGGRNQVVAETEA